jgi:hypothetical protein
MLDLLSLRRYPFSRSMLGEGEVAGGFSGEFVALGYEVQGG